MLEVKNVNSFYGDFQALFNVSLDLYEGEILGIIGPNGAGKTTLLNTIFGFIRPRSGEIRFLDKRIDGLQPHEIAKLGIRYIRETLSVFPELTVLENLKIGAYENWDNFREMLDLVYTYFPVLKERKDQRAGTLSGGERKMLGIAQALMGKPKLLLIDELSLGLAPIIVDRLLSAIKELNEHEKLTVLMVEQQITKLLKCVRRAYLMEVGKIVMKGESSELLKNPYVRQKYLGL